jgi:hypothetical protein
MKKIFVLIALIISLGFSQASADPQVITISLPEAVVMQAIEKALPLTLDDTAKTIGGTITIEKIDGLRFGDRTVTGNVVMVGRDVQVNTEIAGHQIMLKIGNVDLHFQIDAALRYDQASQTLFIRPQLTDLKNGTKEQNMEVGNLITGLFHDKELPLAIDRLQPIIADIGSKKLIIDMRIDDIVVQPGALVLHILPDTKLQEN